MEKFRQFGDGGTGVNPFVPVWSNYKAYAVVRAVKYMVMAPIAVLRLGFFMLAMCWLLVAEGVDKFVPIKFIRSPINQLLVWIGARQALVAVGILTPFCTTEQLADYRRLKLAPPKDAADLDTFDAEGGCLVICNMQSLVDVLFLAMKLCPTFVFPAADGTPVRLSVLAALSRAGARRLEQAPASPQKLAAIVEEARAKWRGPVVLFAEGTRTNGSGVLVWKPKTFEGVDFEKLPDGVALAALEYNKTGAYTPHHTVGTTFRHLFWMCMQPWHTVKGTWLCAKPTLEAIKGKPHAEQVALLRSVLTRMITGAVEVDVAADKHTEFMGYWDASQRKGYTKAQEAAQAEKKKTK